MIFFALTAIQFCIYFVSVIIKDTMTEKSICYYKVILCTSQNKISHKMRVLIILFSEKYMQTSACSNISPKTIKRNLITFYIYAA
jgi:hypothetical protein